MIGPRFLDITDCFSNNKILLGGIRRGRNDYDDDLAMGLYRYARENLALVNIYIKDPAVTQVKT
jgi:hypothetical protein